jgi:HD-GYP domain-containing protein (c-di-GMP phosphodiesterase class II)
LEFGAYFHDVGKIHIPLSILNKPAKLEPSEWEVIKKHPIFGRELLDNTFIKEAGVIVEQHHERIDGSGYPYGLSGDEVLIEASIVAVADTYDAMTTDRPYRQALPQEVALEEIRKYIGIHYSKEVVRAFVSALNLIEPKHRI